MTYQSGGFNGQFSYLWLAQGISQFGDALLEITLPVWVGLVTNSPTQVAGVAGAELLPAILVGPMAGVLAERFSPKRIMVFTDILRACTVLLLLEFHGDSTAYLAYIVSFVLSLGTRIFVPAQSVFVRNTIEDEDIPRAQGMLHVASSISLALGPALGGTLLLTLGATPAVILDAGTFAVSTTLLLKIHQETDELVDHPNRNSCTNVRSLRLDIVQGMRYLLGSSQLVVVTIVTAIFTLVGYIWLTVDVFYVKHYLDVPGEAVGYLWTASGIGDSLAGLIIVPLAGKLNSAYLLTGGLFVRAIALMLYAVTGHFGDALLICLFAGFGDGIASIALSTMAMQYLPPSVMGRVSSTLDMVGQFSGIGATVFIAAGGSHFTSRQDLLSCGILLLITMTFAASRTWRVARGQCEVKQE